MVSRSSNPERHAVLALLSERYPPLRGRSPTCYSPVRHSTQDRSPFRVRLACVRHAASVDSEPGSNSHVKVLVRFQTLPDDLRRAFQIRPRPSSTKGLWLFCLSVLYQRSPESSPPTSLAGLGQLEPQRRWLILDGLVAPTRPCGRVENVCTFYLVFKEPRLRRPSITQAIRDSQPTFAFASVEPFRGTFRAYDGHPRLSTLFFVTNSGSTNR